METQRRTQSDRPRGLSQANSLRMAKGGACPPLKRSALTIVEIVIAIFVGSVCAIPLLWMVSSTRTETTQAINYLRAMELANEVIDLSGLVPFKQLESFAGVYKGTLDPVKTRIPTSDSITPFTDDKLTWSKDYDNAFFYRDIEIQPLNDYGHGRFLRKMVVTVSWNEGRAATQGDKTRMRKIVLETILLNDLDPTY